VRDPRHPAHDPEVAAAVGDPVLDVYAAIDASIGRIVDHVGDDAIVMVLSATGMGANYTGNFVLDEVLRRLEGKRKTRGLDWLVRAKQQAKRVLPRGVRSRWRKTSRRIEERVAHADRERRRFFTVPHNDIAGAIRVNLAGREPAGIVRPDELEAVYAMLRRELLALRNLDTGGPVVEDVVRVADHCQGEQLDDMPDFFVLWRREARIERVGSAKVGEVVHRQRGNRTGDHRSDSILFARGPGITPGEMAPCSIMDVAPTIAALLGVGLPQSDGQPIPEMHADVADPGRVADR
jgi:predicted AlkP superfamily phosphohydrolase/phosphomutase